MLTTRRGSGFQRATGSGEDEEVGAAGSNKRWGPVRKRKWEQQGPVSNGVRRGVAAAASDSSSGKGREGGSGGLARATTAGSGEEAREEGEDSGSPMRAAATGEGGGCGVSVRSAQRWLRLRAREATTLADGKSREERRGLCAGGAAAEEGVAAAVVEEEKATVMCSCCGLVAEVATACVGKMGKDNDGRWEDAAVR
ncbi:hypothetical protein BHM03_00017278 [Ensete ventricosum]|nr:hypothetical protein BHM03_00017278 [Ensete ventricosum]